MLQVKVIESFKIGKGIILEIQHQLKGIPSETILISEQSKLKWKIQHRILSHSMKIHHLFENENTSNIFLSFKSLEQKNESIEKTKERELNSIYSYYAKAIEHDEKPSQNEVLTILNQT